VIDKLTKLQSTVMIQLEVDYRTFRCIRGVDPVGVLTRTILKNVGRVRVCFDPPNVTFFHSKLLLDNPASFTSSRMTDLCQKSWKLKIIFEALTGCQEA